MVGPVRRQAHQGRDAHGALLGCDGPRATRLLAAEPCLPRLLEGSRGSTGAVLGGDGAPEGLAVTPVDGLQAGHVDVAGVVPRPVDGGEGCVEAERLLLLMLLLVMMMLLLLGKGALLAGCRQRGQGHPPRLVDGWKSTLRHGRGPGQDGGEVDLVDVAAEDQYAILWRAGGAGRGAAGRGRGHAAAVVDAERARHGRAGQVAPVALTMDLVVVQAAG